MKRATLLAVVLFFIGIAPAFALDNGLALVPPMGWNSWNKFGCNVSESLIKQMADAMVSSGMKDAGYQYIVIDDCWQVKRDSDGTIVADPERFPDGMKALAEYVHSKGLKFGLYSDAGTATCQRRPGSRGYEFEDARTYASWGVDYLKFDWCNTGSQNVQASYETMRDALKASGRPIVFSMCEWGVEDPAAWAATVGNLWRTTGDINPSWRRIMQILNQNEPLWPYAGPGHWNDPDMLEVGNGRLTLTESKSHFSLWCMMAAPLIAGNDLRDMPADVKSILTNREVITIDQDPFGKQGQRIMNNPQGTQVWRKQLTGGAVAYLLLNAGDQPQEMSVNLGRNAKARDLWKHEAVAVGSDGIFAAQVESHGVVMLRVENGE